MSDEVLELSREQIELIRERAPFDLNLVASILLPDEFIAPFPPHYEKLYQHLIGSIVDLQPEQELRFAIGIPRGFCKTTLLKIICFIVIKYRLRSFVSWIGSSEDNAENAVADIIRMLKSEQVQKIWGPQRFERESKSQYIIRYDEKSVFVLEPHGALTSVRGSNTYNVRPDMIIADDMQTLENAQSEADSRRLKTWFWQTLYFALEQGKKRGTALFYAGNYLEGDCILHELHQSPKFLSFVVGAILENGQSLWPEYQSVEKLLDSYQVLASVGQAGAFLAEKLNTHPKQISGALKYTETIEPHLAAFVVVDPSSWNEFAKSATKSDDYVACVHLRFRNGWGVGEHVSIRGAAKSDPKVCGLAVVELALRYEASHILIENGLLLRETLGWIREAMIDLDVSESEIELKSVSHMKQSKERRAQNFLTAMHFGSWRIVNRTTYEELRRLMPEGVFVEDRNGEDGIMDVASYGPIALGQHPEIQHAVRRDFTYQRLRNQTPRVDGHTPSAFLDRVPLRVAGRQ